MKSHLHHHLGPDISKHSSTHGFIAFIVAVHYAVKQGDKSSVKTLLDGLTPDQQLNFLSTKDKDGKAAAQLAPADVRKDMDKMLAHYKREADFEVNYGGFVLFSMLTRFGIRQWTSF